MDNRREQPSEQTPGGPKDRVFLLRCWQEDAETREPSAWRFTLIKRNQERTQKGFATLDELFTHLAQQLELTS